MDIGIVGLPNSGKTTVFNALTGADIATAAYTGSGDEINVAVVKVPDPRLDFLFDLHKPPKKVHSELKYLDFAMSQKSDGGSGFSDKHIADMRNCDALLLVVRAFDDGSVPHPDNRIDPAADIENLLLELKFADMKVVENRIARINESTKRCSKEERARLQKELLVMENINEMLQRDDIEIPLRMEEKEEKLTRSYGLLTIKPLLVLVNVSEAQLGGGEADKLDGILSERMPALELAGKLEAEISQLDPEEQVEFLSDAGISEPAASYVIRRTYQLVGLINFYTGSSKTDVHAWALEKGANAVEAAGKIHSDIARGFIRAEVITFETLKELGSMQAVKDAGKFRLEGKEYIVNDGDIITFRFNV